MREKSCRVGVALDQVPVLETVATVCTHSYSVPVLVEVCISLPDT